MWLHFFNTPAILNSKCRAFSIFQSPKEDTVTSQKNIYLELDFNEDQVTDGPLGAGAILRLVYLANLL